MLAQYQTVVQLSIVALMNGMIVGLHSHFFSFSQCILINQLRISTSVFPRNIYSSHMMKELLQSAKELADNTIEWSGYLTFRMLIVDIILISSMRPGTIGRILCCCYRNTNDNSNSATCCEVVPLGVRMTWYFIQDWKFRNSVESLLQTEFRAELKGE